jgi:type II secretory pathway predicted ATPase ExeA
LVDEHIKLLNGLNYEQRKIYNAVIGSVIDNNDDVFFIYGHGGTEKTYLWRTLIYRLRSEGKIVIAVASFVIAALLLYGKRTASLRFQILINVMNIIF